MASHIPVLLSEVLEHLQLRPQDTVVDATFGAGGYTAEILKRVSPSGTVLALDLDEQSLAAGRQTFKSAPVIFSQTNFAHMREALESHGLKQVSAVVFDLGVSSMQFDQARRGFSVKNDGPLDMRFGMHDEFDESYGKVTAHDMIHRWSEDELYRIFRENGEERYARKIARAITRRRKQQPFTGTADFASFVAKANPSRDKHIHPATRVFQALRIEVNNELENLQRGLEAALEILKPGGRMATVSFHSLEDRIVKNFGKQEARDCVCPPDIPECRCQHEARLNIITKKVVTPTLEEVRHNPRARSAKLRVFEKRKR